MPDLIEREVVLDALNNAAEYHSHIDDCTENTIRQCISVVKKILAIDAVPVVHGRWERVTPTKSAAKWSGKVSCCICHKSGHKQYHYCPHCGAKMDLEES